MPPLPNTAVRSSKEEIPLPSAPLKSLDYKPPTTGLLSHIPPSWIPYAELMRLDRPDGYYAFYWHYAIGLGLAACLAKPAPSPVILLHLALHLAAFVVFLRGAACTWNDNLDQDFDRQVIRCRNRPIARGAVSTFNGHVFAFVQAVLGAALLLPLPTMCLMHAGIMAIVLAVYPLCKRITYFPQVVLGFGLAHAIFLCCAAVGVDQIVGLGRTSSAGGGPAILMVYGAGMLWTVTFDTIYAHQDLEDDIKTGVKSLAVCLGGQTKSGLTVLAVGQVTALSAAGIQAGFSAVYFVVSCGGAAAALGLMLLVVDLKKPASCAWWFGPGSRLVGMSVVMGLMGEYVLL